MWFHPPQDTQDYEPRWKCTRIPRASWWCLTYRGPYSSQLRPLYDFVFFPEVFSTQEMGSHRSIRYCRASSSQLIRALTHLSESILESSKACQAHLTRHSGQTTTARWLEEISQKLFRLNDTNKPEIISVQKTWQHLGHVRTLGLTGYSHSGSK